MDVTKATELAYKNGYEKGLKLSDINPEDIIKIQHYVDDMKIATASLIKKLNDMGFDIH